MSQIETLSTELLKIIGSVVDFSDMENLYILSPRLSQVCQDKQLWINLIHHIRPPIQSKSVSELKKYRFF